MNATDYRALTEHQLGPDGVLHVRIHAGDLTLRAATGTTVRVRDLDGRDLRERFDIETTPGSLTVRPQAPLGELGLLLGGRRSSRIDVELPATTTIVAETVSADVTATGLNGAQRYRTTSGDLRLSAVRGSIAVETVSGDLELDGDGDIELTARLVSGSATVAAPRINRLAITTTSGDVQLAGLMVGSGPFAIRTVSGDARLTVGGDVRIEGRSLTGRIRSDRPHRINGRPGRRNVTVEGQGPLVSFESVSGGLRIDEPTGASRMTTSPIPVVQVDANEAARLEALRALERGEINVAEATARLAALDPEPAPVNATDEGASA